MNEKPSKWLLATLLALPATPLVAIALIATNVSPPTAFFATGAAWGIAGWIAILAFAFRLPKGERTVKYVVLCLALGAACGLISLGLSFLGRSDGIEAAQIATLAAWVALELAGFVLLAFSARKTEPAMPHPMDQAHQTPDPE